LSRLSLPSAGTGRLIASDTVFYFTAEIPLKPTQIIIRHVYDMAKPCHLYHIVKHVRRIIRSVHSSGATFQTSLTGAYANRALSALQKECTPPRQSFFDIQLLLY
jgi:hypothetical protein